MINNISGNSPASQAVVNIQIKNKTIMQINVCTLMYIYKALSRKASKIYHLTPNPDMLNEYKYNSSLKFRNDDDFGMINN